MKIEPETTLALELLAALRGFISEYDGEMDKAGRQIADDLLASQSSSGKDSCQPAALSDVAREAMGRYAESKEARRVLNNQVLPKVKYTLARMEEEADSRVRAARGEAPPPPCRT